MKYILILGLYYQKYKKDIRIEISSGGTLIDDIVTDQNINRRDIPQKDILNLMAGKYFCYEVNGDALANDITVKCTLHDNNYTNGFMTKTAMALIECIALVPKSFVINFCPYARLKRWGKEQTIQAKKLMEKFGINDLFILSGRDKRVLQLDRQLKAKKVKYQDLTKTQKALIHNVQVNEKVGHWPCNPFNIQLHQDGKELEPIGEWIGGEFQATVSLIRKHGIIMCDPYPAGKQYGNIKFVRSFGKLFRKYQTVNTSR